VSRDKEERENPVASTSLFEKQIIQSKSKRIIHTEDRGATTGTHIVNQSQEVNKEYTST